jgi:hypothetical protein
MDPTRARALVRLERACAESPPLARAWRTGALSWVKAAALVPLTSADPLGRFAVDWVSWAGRVTVRRLRDDAEHALALAETDPEAFRRAGGLPVEARRRTVADDLPGAAGPDRGIRANDRGAEGESRRGGRGGSNSDEEPGGAERENRADHRNPEGESRRVGGDGRDDVDGAHREIRANDRDPERNSLRAGNGRNAGDPESGAERESGARWRADESEEGLPSYFGLAARAHVGLNGRPRPDETCWLRLMGSPAALRLFRTALCTVRRRIEADTGRLPTAGEALDAMLDHVFAAWGEDAKVPARHRVFARDGWRCAAPGCSSMQNLHDHHVRFRSAGGSDALENRVTLCAFHHLRGVHAGRLRCTGRAPDGLTWQLGIRPGTAPLLSYRSGDVRMATAAP